MKQSDLEADDHELMQRIAEGDRNAFGLLMRRHLPAVMNFNRQYLPLEAEDVAQEAFIRLWKKAPQWRELGVSPKAWLMKVSYNLCIDELRKRKTETLDDLPMQIADPSGSSERFWGARSDLQQQMRALNALPERQRSAIVLSVCSGLNNREAAAVLNISVDALESLLARGRRTLKKTFAAATGYSGGDTSYDHD